MVLIKGAGKDDGGVLVDSDLDEALRVAKLQRERVSHHRVRCVSECCSGEGLALGVDDLRALSRSASACVAIAGFMLSES